MNTDPDEDDPLGSDDDTDLDTTDYFRTRAEIDERTLEKQANAAPRLRRTREGRTPAKRKTKGR